MAFRGHIRNGVVELDLPANLPEGAEVRVDLVPVGTESPDARTGNDREIGATLYDRLRHVIGKIDDLPEDFSRNHDHYLYGTPRK